MPTVYEQNIYHLRENFDIYAFQVRIYQWLRDLPPILNHDSNIVGTLMHALSELMEIQEERSRMGTPEYNQHAFITEGIDTGYMPLATAAANAIWVKPEQVHYNGFGNKSWVYDLIKEIIGNITTKKELEKHLPFLVSVIFSAIADTDKPFDINQKVDSVFRKNYLNHPPIVFPGHNPKTGELLRGEWLEAAHTYGRAYLRELRNFLLSEVGRRDAANGIRRSDFFPHMETMHAFFGAKTLEEAATIHAIQFGLFKDEIRISQVKKAA